MSKVFDSNHLKQLAEEMSRSSLILFKDMPRYPLFLSQVVDYLNDNFPDENITSNVIQNYTKLEAITRPEDSKKRGYNKTQLIQLTLITYMRSLLTTDEIKKVFKLAFNEINDNDDDILSWEETYKTFTKIQEESMINYSILSLTDENRLDELINQFDLKNGDKERIKIFLLVLSLIAEASIIKRIVKKIINNYSTY